MRFYSRASSFSLFLFSMASLYGLLMRYYNAFGLPMFPYFNFLQAHSHVAFLGWGFVAAILLHVKILDAGCSKSRGIAYSIWAMLISMLAILITFPLYGYRGPSVAFLSLFVLASYVYSVCFFRCSRNISGLPIKFFRFALLLYLVSTIAIWALAPIIIIVGKNTSIYFDDIYFFLHFLYNGFFVFAISGILFHYFRLPENFVWKFFYLNAIAVFPAYLLSLLWRPVPTWVYAGGFLAALLQVIALIWLVRGIVPATLHLTLSDRVIVLGGIVSYALKVIIQLFSSIPAVVSAAIHLKPYLVIGYLHLITLGYISTLLLYFLYREGLLGGRWFWRGFWMFFYSAAFKVAILIIYGLVLWWFGWRFAYIHEILFFITTFLFSGVLLIWISTLSPKGGAGA